MFSQSLDYFNNVFHFNTTCFIYFFPKKNNQIFKIYILLFIITYCFEVKDIFIVIYNLICINYIPLYKVFISYHMNKLVIKFLCNNFK